MGNSIIKKLDICFPPPMYYSLHVAISLSIILANEENRKWFYNNFIQVSYYNGYLNDQSGHAYSIYPATETRPGQFAASQFLVEKHIDQNVINFKKGDIVSDTINFINEGYYVSCIADVSKLKDTTYEKRDFFAHGMMIFGYDLYKHFFYVLDFDKKRRINIIEVSFEDYYQAFSSERLKMLFKTDINNSIILYEKKRREYHLDLEIIRDLLRDYLTAYNTSRKYALFLPCNENSTWGMATYGKITEYLKQVDDYIDYRMFHAFYEHKKIMVERILFFRQDKILDIGNEVLQQLNDNKKLSEIVRMLVLKYNITRNRNLITKIINNMDIIKKNEYLAYREIIRKINEVTRK